MSDQDLRARFAGTWKLVGVEREVAGSGEKLDAGVTQTGYICYTTEPRMMVIIRRMEPGKPQEIISYTGAWSIKGDVVIHHVDMSNRESWVNTDQVRHFRFEGNKLILTPPESPDYTHGSVTRRSLTWEKI